MKRADTQKHEGHQHGRILPGAGRIVLADGDASDQAEQHHGENDVHADEDAEELADGERPG
jgi:hypothetical protein